MIRICWHKWSNWTEPRAEYSGYAQYSVCEKCGLSKRKGRFFMAVSPDLGRIRELYQKIFGN